MELERTNVAGSGDHANALRADRPPRVVAPNPTVRMSDFLIRDAIIPTLTANTKEGVIREMIHSLGRSGQLHEEDLEDAICLVLRREQLGATGIGRGIAIPHAKANCVDRLTGTLALSRSGVPFASLDDKPVFIFVLLISPVQCCAAHLRALELLVRTMRDDTFVQHLRQAQLTEEIWRLLESA